MRQPKPLAILFLSLAALGAGAPALRAQAWPPSAGHTQIPIWPGTPPAARSPAGHEVAGVVIDSAGRPRLVGGRPWTYVDSVSRPTITVYAPTGTTNRGAAVIVFPGGASGHCQVSLYRHEGW